MNRLFIFSTFLAASLAYSSMAFADSDVTAEQKAQNAATYDAAKVIVMEELGTTEQGVTIGELFDAIADKLPEGFTKGKLQYAMTRLWKDELVRTEGKVNTYAVKA